MTELLLIGFAAATLYGAYVSYHYVHQGTDPPVRVAMGMGGCILFWVLLALHLFGFPVGEWLVWPV